MSGNPAFTIIVTVDTSVNPPKLTYSDDRGPGGRATGTKKHRILNNCDVSWLCPQAPIFVQFTGTRRIFTNDLQGFEVSVSAPANTKTPPLTTKNNKLQRKSKYFVAVASTPMAGEDPELEDGGGGGGGGGKKKTASKKKTAKKKKAAKKR